MTSRALALLALPALAGCVHRVEVTTVPAGAVVYQDGQRLGPAPVVVEVHPFQAARRRHVSATLPGYRDLDVRLPLSAGTWGFAADVVTLRWGRALGRRAHSSCELRLVPEHGGVGTWDPEDVD